MPSADEHFHSFETECLFLFFKEEKENAFLGFVSSLYSLSAFLGPLPLFLSTSAWVPLSLFSPLSSRPCPCQPG